MKSLGVLLCDDLIFSSRITGTARHYDLELKVARNPIDLEKYGKEKNPVCLILDLHNSGLNIEQTVQSFSDSDHRPYIVGYGSHVATEVLKAAREAGCDLVLPRSKFVEDLPKELPNWFAGNHPSA